MNFQEEQENLLNRGASPKKATPSQDNDEKMGMAVMNLSAMLNIEDLDKVIKLLEENNWDESQAANAYMAQQVASGAGDAPRAQNANEEHKYDDDGVRAPIQQQEDQLIGESPFESIFRSSIQRQAQANRPRTAHLPQNNGPNDPFIQDNDRRAQSEQLQQIPRLRGPRPRDFTFNIDIPYDDPSDYENVERPGQVRQQQQQRTWGQYIGSMFYSIWSAIKWAFTLGGTITSIGPDQQDFDCGQSILNDDRLLAALEMSGRERFFKTCMKSRAHKKPMLLCVVNNPEDQQQVDLLIQNLVENSPDLRDMLQGRFNLFVVSQEQLENKLMNCNEVFRVAPTDDINMFVLFIKSQFKISIMHRIVQNVLIDPSQMAASLLEYASLFDIQAEEDPGYRQLQLLQDAGIIPVDIHQQAANPFSGMGGGAPMMGSRPRGVSDNVPQEAIDELLREDPTQGHLGDLPPEQPPLNSNNKPTNNIQSIHSQNNIQRESELVQPEAAKKKEPERKVINMPEEPAQGEPDATNIGFRMPLSGERLQRRFLKTDKIQLLYDFIDDLQNQDKCKFDGVESYTDQYHLFQIRPKVVYENKEQTLEEAGLWPRGPILQIQHLEEKDESD